MKLRPQHDEGEIPEKDHRFGQDLAAVDTQMAIARMRRQIEELGGFVGGPIGSDPPLDPAMEAAFLQRVLAFETGPETTLAALLEGEGIVLPPAGAFPADPGGDAALHEKLSEVTRGLAAHSVVLEHPGPLSDRALYDWLVTDALQEPTRLPGRSALFFLQPPIAEELQW